MDTIHHCLSLGQSFQQTKLITLSTLMVKSLFIVTNFLLWRDQEPPQEVDDKEEGKEESIFGPSISFAGQPARWTGDSYSYADQIGIEARVTFESLSGDRVTSYLYIINDGTTSVYYDWKVREPVLREILKETCNLIGKVLKLIFWWGGGVWGILIR